MVIPLKVQEIVAEAADEFNADIRFTTTEEGFAFIIRYPNQGSPGITVVTFLPDTEDYTSNVYVSGNALNIIRDLL